MPKRTRRHRDRYLDHLAEEPLFHGVAGHLLATVGRIVDPLCLAAGVSTPCTPTKETIIITKGHALLTDTDHQPIAIIGPGGAIGHSHPNQTTGPQHITAITSLRGYVIARRELPTLIAIAPALLAAIAHTETAHTPVGTNNRANTNTTRTDPSQAPNRLRFAELEAPVSCPKRATNA